MCHLGRTATFIRRRTPLLIYADTLIQAVSLRRRLDAFGLIVNLDSVRYYVFHSRQSPEQVANTVTSQKIAVHLRLVRTPQPPNPWDKRSGSASSRPRAR
jgi:hypothetical protein